MEIKIVEITGPPGSGKSTYLDKSFAKYKVFCGYSPREYNRFQRLWLSAKKLSLYWKLHLSSYQFRWLIKQTIIYNETKFARINALRNAILKFSYSLDNNSSYPVVIDEGISHIPFLFQLNETGIREFILLFRDHFKKREIHFLISPPEDELYNRIRKRGHRRARSNEELSQLIKKNLEVCEAYKAVLRDMRIPVKFIGSGE